MRKPRILQTILAATMLSTVMACGGGGGGGGSDSATAALSADEASHENTGGSCGGAVAMPASLLSTWQETEQCTGMSSEPPRVVFSPTVVCPRSGADNCLATVPFFTCSSDSSQTCGAIGRFLPDCNAIELPDHFSGGAAHEMIHYLLRQSGRGDWAQHSGSEWICQ